MAIGLESFGPGGEALGGLFLGNQIAQQEQAQDVANQKTLADIANTQEITRQRALGNQETEALMADKIADARMKYKAAADQNAIDKYTRGSQAMSKMGAQLGALPAAARPAALKEMATAYGIGDDNQMLSHLMSVDPNELPNLLEGYSKTLYDQSDAARTAANKSEEAYKLAKMQRESAENIARGNNATQLQVANINAQSRENVANTRGAAGSGNGALAKMSIDQRISYLETKKALGDNWDDAQETALENLKRFKLSQSTVGKPDTAGAMGLAPTADSRIENAIRGGSPTKPASAQGTPQISSKAEYDKLPSGAKYLDPQGNTRTKR